MVPRWKGVFSELVNPTSNGIAGLRVSAVSKGNNPKDRRDKNTTERRFSELVILKGDIELSQRAMYNVHMYKGISPRRAHVRLRLRSCP